MKAEYHGEVGQEKPAFYSGVLGDEGEKLGSSQIATSFYGVPKFKNHKTI